jgi:hypothetical protein
MLITSNNVMGEIFDCSVDSVDIASCGGISEGGAEFFWFELTGAGGDRAEICASLGELDFLLSTALYRCAEALEERGSA